MSQSEVIKFYLFLLIFTQNPDIQIVFFSFQYWFQQLSTIQFRIRSFSMFIFNNEVLITFFQGLIERIDCCALQ